LAFRQLIFGISRPDFSPALRSILGAGVFNGSQIIQLKETKYIRADDFFCDVKGDVDDRDIKPEVQW